MEKDIVYSQKRTIYLSQLTDFLISTSALPIIILKSPIEGLTKDERRMNEG